jgi:CRISPR/Cas system CSM-associated protein Csm3 (group 7 of RAMP superfamily)
MSQGRRVRIAARLVTASGLHAGAAPDALSAAARGEGVGRRVVRDGRGWPYVPGALVRGGIRAALSDAVAGLGDVAWYPGGGEPVARLFGAGGAVRVGDALAVPDEAVSPARWVERREGRAVDPRTGDAPDARAFDFEVVAPGVCFDLEIFAEELADWELGLLCLGFDLLDGGFVALGGLTGRGLGRVRVALRGVLDLSLGALLRAGGAAPPEARRPVEEARACWAAALEAHVRALGDGLS